MNTKRGVESVLSRIPSYSSELGIDLGKPEGRFKWFLASVLFAKRISADIAKRTYSRFEAEGLTTPEAITRAGWDRLVQTLDAGGYVRYDFSTATNLLEMAKALKQRYGDLERVHREAADPRELEKRLQELRGVGPTATNIFLRELRGVWEKARPKPSELAIEVADRLGLKDVERFESALVRIRLEYCKRRKCKTCPVTDYCKAKRSSSRRMVA